MFYKGLVRSTNNYAFHMWESATSTHFLKLQVFFQMAQYSGTVIEASRYVTNKRINELLDVPFFADHTTALRALIQNLSMKVLR